MRRQQPAGAGARASFDECVGVARAAIDLGVNFLDTAEVYGTEEIVGAAGRTSARGSMPKTFMASPGSGAA
ncbi:aldo/keto reductase [Reyranella aquatilis]|uniref:aldo/keto reductase n=1 Tax=Reyranella aquatilis TaxID=2035356 RepID=UPI0038B432CF